MPNLNFPARFFKKLDIYQQVAKGKGIAKHERLWDQEAAFLRWGYSKRHQYKKSWVVYDRVKEEISFYTNKSKSDLNEVEETIGNLYFKKLIDVHKYDKEKKGDEQYEKNGFNPPEAEYIEKLSERFKFRPTLNGLEVGEVLSEINDPNILTRSWHKAKYKFWILAIWAILWITLFSVIILFVKEIHLFIDWAYQLLSSIRFS